MAAKEKENGERERAATQWAAETDGQTIKCAQTTVVKERLRLRRCGALAAPWGGSECVLVHVLVRVRGCVGACASERSGSEAACRQLSLQLADTWPAAGSKRVWAIDYYVGR